MVPDLFILIGAGRPSSLDLLHEKGQSAERHPLLTCRYQRGPRILRWWSCSYSRVRLDDLLIYSPCYILFNIPQAFLLKKNIVSEEGHTRTRTHTHISMWSHTHISI